MDGDGGLVAEVVGKAAQCLASQNCLTSRDLEQIVPWGARVTSEQIDEMASLLEKLLSKKRVLPPIIHHSNIAIKKLLARANKRGVITYDELNEALPQDQMSSEQIEDVMSAISEMGVNIVEAVDASDAENDFATEESLASRRLWSPGSALVPDDIHPALSRLYIKHQDLAGGIKAAKDPATPTEQLILLVGLTTKIDNLLALHPSADARILRELARSPGAVINRSILRHPAANAAVLRIMADRRDHSSHELILEHEATNADVLDALSVSRSDSIRRRVARRADTSEKTLRQLLPHYPNIVIANVAFAPALKEGAAYLEKLDSLDLRNLLHNRETPAFVLGWAQELAADPATSPRTLYYLADGDTGTRRLVATNPSINRKTAALLATNLSVDLALNSSMSRLLAEEFGESAADRGWDGLSSKCITAILSQPSCLPETRDWACTLAGDPATGKDILLRLIGVFPDVVADNPVFDWLLIEDPKLLASIDEDVVCAMARHPCCPKKLVDLICSTEVKTAQLAVLRRGDLEPAHLEKLRRSAFPRVAENAVALLLKRDSPELP